VDTPTTPLIRAVPPTVLLRAAGADSTDDRLATLYGHFSRFGEWYEIDSYYEGKFLERTAAGAFTKTMKERADQIKVLFNHGHDTTVGGKILGRIESLAEDKDGPAYEVALYDTTYNRDLLPGLRDGAYGASFMFRVIRDEWNDEPGVSEHNPKGIPERTVTEVQLYEFGPVTFPASEAATAGARSLTDRFIVTSPTADGQAPLAGRAAGDADGTGTPAPPTGHDGASHGERAERIRSLLLPKDTP